MTNRHSLSFADQRFVGNAYHPGANVEDRRGVRVADVVTKQWGAPAAANASGVTKDTTASGAATATGDLVSGGIATFDVPRNVTVLSTGADSPTVTITGTDEYSRAVVEDIVAASGALASGLKAFLTVSGVSLSATAVGIDVGTGDRLGLHYRLANLDYMMGLTIDGASMATTATVVAGMGATEVSTATTADVRGTVTPMTVADASLRFGALFVMQDQLDSGAKAYGPAQFGG